MYVYSIVVNQNIQPTITATYLEFRINGTKIRDYQHEPVASSSDFLYDIPVYTNTALPNGNHTLTIATMTANYPSMFLFDYLEYM